MPNPAPSTLLDRLSKAQIAVLAEALRALGSVELDLDQSIGTLSSVVARHIGDACVITLATLDRTQLRVAGYDHCDPAEKPALRELVHGKVHPLDAGLFGSVFTTGKSVLVADRPPEAWKGQPLEEYRPYVQEHRLNQLLIVPLRTGGEILGTVGISRGQGSRPYTDEERLLLEEIAEFAALIILRSRSAAERERADRLLRESERQFHTLAESIPQIVWVADAAGSLKYCNGKWEELTGKKLPIGGQPMEDLQGQIHPEDLKALDAATKRAYASGGPFEVEYRIRSRDGSYRWHLGRAIPFRDEHGRTLGRFGTATDIHAQREAEDRLRQLADAMPQIVWSAGADGRIEYCNRRWYSFTGRSPDSAIEQPSSWIRMMKEDYARDFKRRWEEGIGSGQAFEMECELWDASRLQYRWHLGRAVPVRDEQGKLVRWHGTFTEIDEQKRAIEELRISQDRYHRAMESAGMASWEYSIARDCLVHATSNYDGLYGLDEVRARPRTTAEFFENVHPEDRERVRAEIQSVTSGKSSGYAFQFRVNLPQGRTRKLATRGQGVLSPEGALVGIRGVTFDVAELTRGCGATA